MRRHIGRVWLAASLASACLAGCQGSSGSTYPADPLFAGKRPIEARAEAAPPVTVASAEPTVPPVPAVILAQANGQPQPGPELQADRHRPPANSVPPRPLLTASHSSSPAP
jgi:hypothetical protein